MNINLLKQIAILSAILGAILGAITVIPFIGIISFIVCVFAAGSLVIWYLSKLELVGELETKQWSIYGAISGFISFLGFSLSFIPLSALIGIFYKQSYHLGLLIMLKMGFFVMLLMVIFVALISALLNGFGAMATSYILNLIKEQKESDEQ